MLRVCVQSISHATKRWLAAAAILVIVLMLGYAVVVGLLSLSDMMNERDARFRARRRQP